MSRCISPDGEYSDHVYNGETLGSEFNCARCFVYDEDAADAEIVRLRVRAEAAEAKVAAVQRVLDDASADPEAWRVPVHHISAALGGDHEQPKPVCAGCNAATGAWITHERGCPVERGEDEWVGNRDDHEQPTQESLDRLAAGKTQRQRFSVGDHEQPKPETLP